MTTILDQLKAIQMVPLQLPNLSDTRALRVAQMLMAGPGNCLPLAQVCRVSGAGKRTVERLFRSETGMTFGKWRQQLRFMPAGRGRKGYARRSGSRLQYAERIHRRVPEGSRDHACTVFQDVGKRLIALPFPGPQASSIERRGLQSALKCSSNNPFTASAD